MGDRWLVVAAFAGAVGSGVIGGVFYAFSTFVMRALARLSAGEAIAAMRAINVAVINPWFLGVFLGTAGVSAAVAVGALMRWERPGAGWVLLGAGLYLVGTFGVTMACNVPLNNALEKTGAGDAEFWGHYLRRWTAWNHVRTAAGVGAMGAFAWGLRAWGGG